MLIQLSFTIALEEFFERTKQFSNCVQTLLHVKKLMRFMQIVMNGIFILTVNMSWSITLALTLILFHQIFS